MLYISGMEVNGKKILVVGLGTLGGGVATTKWLLAQGADVTVTDLRSRAALKDSIKELEKCVATLPHPKGTMRAHSTLRFVLGRHRMEDFTGADLIVMGGGVKIIGNKFLAAARKKGIPIVNDLALFLENVKNPVVAITGTRGKTTTANWTAHFLKAKYKNVRASGNSSDDALLKLLPRLAKDKKLPAVLELSSFQLEGISPDLRPDNSVLPVRSFTRRRDELSGRMRAPDIAIITNLSRDHLNRHETMRNYARAKANIFMRQTSGQKLILNLDNPWTKFFLKEKPKAQVYGISLREKSASTPFLIGTPRPSVALCEGGNRKIRGGMLSVTATGGKKEVVFHERGKARIVLSRNVVNVLAALGEHNMYNFLASALAAHLMGVSWGTIERSARSLPQIALRQEVILHTKNLTVVNDSAGTSPEATIAAIRRFKSEGLVLITGGTDKDLAFKELAREIKKNVPPEHLFLLNGSATKKLVRDLKKLGYFKNTSPKLFEDFKKLLLSVKLLITNYRFPITLLFSPGAASFEKFKNEFDRGETFGRYAMRFFIDCN